MMHIMPPKQPRRSRMPWPKRLAAALQRLSPLADAEQMTIAADVEALVGDGERSPHHFAEVALAEHCKGRLGGEDEQVAFDAGGVDLAIHQHGRGVERGPFEAFEPDLLAGLRFVATGQAGIV